MTGFVVSPTRLRHRLCILREVFTYVQFYYLLPPYKVCKFLMLLISLGGIRPRTSDGVLGVLTTTLKELFPFRLCDHSLGRVGFCLATVRTR